MTQIIYGNIKDGMMGNLQINHPDGSFKLIGRLKGDNFQLIKSESMDSNLMDIESKYFENYQCKSRILKDLTQQEFTFAVLNIQESMETLVDDGEVIEKADIKKGGANGVDLRDRVQEIIRTNQGYTVDYLQKELKNNLAGIIEELQADFIIYETDGKFYSL
ncbi:hypothetical protein HDV01_005701 [Terramyces sp. JEL0728]|nr:hypothetical protein HDV01_005701 [Terramyces sp. JEL0728]